jgi:lipopolysaccharide export system permease protein
MAKLFMYNLPAMLFYTIPVSFLVAVVTMFLRLSNENELIALFALGIKSNRVVRVILFSAFLFSILLLILSIIKMPQAKQGYREFKAKKLTEAKINISPSKLGQKFGNFFVYVKSKDGLNMRDVVIYTKDKKGSNRLFIAQEANIENKDLIVQLTLNRGSGYSFLDRSLRVIDYKTMQIFQNIKPKPYTYESVKEYWLKLYNNPKKKKRGKILFFIFISLIPITSLYLVSSFAIINPRYQKNYGYLALGVITIGLYVIATVIQNMGSPYLLLGSIITIIVLGLILFRYRVSRFF